MQPEPDSSRSLLQTINFRVQVTNLNPRPGKGQTKKMKKTCLHSICHSFLILFFILFFPTYLFAQNDRDNSIFDEYIPMDEIVVTATKTQRAEQEVSTNMTILTEEDIKQYDATELTDLLRHVPGLTLNTFGGEKLRVSAGFRGMQTNIRGILFMHDGFEINSPTNVLSMLNIPVDRIERIEIVKTPSSVLYGPNGVGGVINIITKKPEKEFEGETSVKYGSDSYVKPSLFM